MTVPPDDTTADTSAIITALQHRLDAALSEKAALAEALATRNSEYGERIAQQAATIDVLRAMSASPDDPQPVFDLIVTRARDLCDAYGVTVYEFDGALIHWRASTGVSDDPSVRQAVEAMYPMAPSREWGVGRAIMDRRVYRIDDLETEPGLNPTLRGITAKSQVALPLMRGGKAIGALALGSRERGGFSDSQVTLLQTLAEQAVIAITSAETYRSLQTRTSDLQESLEYQTATSDVLKVISRSAFDLQPVLDSLVKTAARLCDAEQALIARIEEGSMWLTASVGFPPEYEADRRSQGRMPVNPDAPMVTDRAAVEKRPVHIYDAAAVPGYTDAAIRLGKQRTSLGVPLLSQGEVIGVIVLARQRVEPFTDRQIALVSTFADQAVIAMENTRLVTEQRDALDQQTATAEVLQVINASPGNLAPVFDAIVEKAHRICNFDIGSLVTYDGTFFRAAATRGYGDQAKAIAETPNRPLTVQRALLRGDQFVHIPDLQAYPVDPDDTTTPTFVAASGFRAGLMVPLRKDDTLLGFLTGWRKVAGPFSDKQIALLQNFAAQAVIAIENTRLLAEQREALEHQTATAEVLQVINASPGDLGAVFDAMLEKALTLCGAEHGSLGTYDGDYFRAVASRGYPAAVLETLQGGFHGLENPVTRPLFDGARFVQIPDLGEIDHPIPKAIAALGGFRTVLFVPLRKDDKLLGHISASRQEVRPFAEKEITLLENFAAQAVIAMENARLLDEIRQRQAELRVTFENMGDGVAMFDETPSLVAWNQKFQDILDLPDGVLAERLAFPDYIRYLTERGEYGAGADPEEQIRRVIAFQI